jgi:hypothetical protein
MVHERPGIAGFLSTLGADVGRPTFSVEHTTQLLKFHFTSNWYCMR